MVHSHIVAVGRCERVISWFISCPRINGCLEGKGCRASPTLASEKRDGVGVSVPVVLVHESLERSITMVNYAHCASMPCKLQRVDAVVGRWSVQLAYSKRDMMSGAEVRVGVPTIHAWNRMTIVANAAVVAAHLFAAIASSKRQCTPIRGDLVFGSSAVRAFHPMVSPMTIGRLSDH